MITVVIGRRGCGKTTYIKERLSNETRYVVFDTLGEYDTQEVFYELESCISYLESRQTTYFNCSFRPLSDIEQQAEFLMRAVWILGDCTLVVDEIDRIANPTSIPEELSKNLNYGRHRNIAVIAAARRAYAIPRLLTSQADTLILFNQSEPRDLAYISDYANSECSSKVSTLPRFTYLHYEPFNPEGTKVLTTAAPQRRL